MSNLNNKQLGEILGDLDFKGPFSKTKFENAMT